MKSLNVAKNQQEKDVEGLKVIRAKRDMKRLGQDESDMSDRGSGSSKVYKVRIKGSVGGRVFHVSCQ
jgi:hypothetical protein